jgi:hypothetical protein
MDKIESGIVISSKIGWNIVQFIVLIVLIPLIVHWISKIEDDATTSPWAVQTEIDQGQNEMMRMQALKIESVIMRLASIESEAAGVKATLEFLKSSAERQEDRLSQLFMELNKWEPMPNYKWEPMSNY